MGQGIIDSIDGALVMQIARGLSDYDSRGGKWI